ncbi:hypothetical protein R3P38DRAFT_3557521 [Favolaschia claudopus]|uniref:Uncharacterized protein n=1 Tax=Favolaschia claudopus TaxID=2862362 RepID=A0AAW0B3J1_9AGAR
MSSQTISPASISHSRALKRALSVPSLDKSHAIIRTSSGRLRRMPSFGRPSFPPGQNFVKTASIPVIIVPNNTQSTPCVSSLKRPSLKRKLTPKHLHGLVKLPAHKRASPCVLRKPLKISLVSSFSASASPSSTSMMALHFRSLPSAMSGLFASLMSIVVILLFPTMVAETSRRPAFEDEIIFNEEREQHPSHLPPSPAFASRIADSVTAAYRRTLRRATRARRASSPADAFTAFFKPTPKRVRFNLPVRFALPVPVEPKPETLAIDTPIVVTSSPIALSLPKGSAPAIRPARKPRSQFSRSPLPTVKEGEVLDVALCRRW